VASVVFEDVSKVYPGAVTALAGFSLTVADGEFMVMVGPSGCGKSTTLRLLAGLEEPTTGRMLIGDRDVTGVTPKDRDIAMVFQNYALYPHMTVFDNMAFALRMRRTPREQVEAYVLEAAGILGMEDYLHRKPRELSGGQRQRVAVGRAIVRHPAVFLFDEPLSNLDAKLRVQMRNELSRLHTRLGATMIYVTHDQAEAMTLGDRIVVLRDGLVQQIAPPLELYDRPCNRFVAGFIGSPAMNFLPAVKSEEGDFVLAGRWRVPFRCDEAEAGVGYFLGVRPEDITPGDAGSLRGTVTVVETLGNEKLVYAGLEGFEMVMRCAPDVPAVTGETIALSIDPVRAHLFDAEGYRVGA
jgi:multiple sugar transport system ATP-binding protein